MKQLSFSSDGGLFFCVRRPGVARWNPQWLFAGLTVGVLVHLLVYLVVLAIPWRPLLDHQEVSWTDPRLLPGPDRKPAPR